jgi:hypothetical protein
MTIINDVIAGRSDIIASGNDPLAMLGGGGTLGN